MSNTIDHKCNEGTWTCFGNNHFNGGLPQLTSMLDYDKVKSFANKNVINEFMEEVHTMIDIGIVEVEDSDFVTWGTLRRIAEKYGYIPKK